MNDSGTVDSREVLEHIRTIVEDSIIRDSELEVCNRAIDLALKSIDDCGLLRTQLEIAEQTIKQNEWVSVDDRLPTKEDILFNDEPNFAITYKNNWNEIKTTYCYFDFEKKRFRITGVDVLAWKTFGEPYKESE
jgi:hypothetical protein